MMHFIRNLAFAAVAAVSLAGSAQAATIELVPVPDPGVTASLADNYFYDEQLVGAGGADTRAFTFSLPGTSSMSLTAVNLTLSFVQGSSVTGAFMAWTDGVTTNQILLSQVFDSATNTFLGWSGVLDTILSTSSPVQDLVIGWSGYSGPVQVSLQVETAAVPLPAGGLLLIGGLGALALVRRRKAAA